MAKLLILGNIILRSFYTILQQYNSKNGYITLYLFVCRRSITACICRIITMIFGSTKCFRIASIGLLYIFLSLGFAVVCHRLYFAEYEGADWAHYLFGSVIFAGSLVCLYTWLQFRIFIFLLVPKLFNVNGRTVLLIYMTYLTLWGPLLNTKRNIQVMSTTLVCSFEEIRAGAAELIEIMKEPVVYLKKLIDTMEETSKKIFAQLARELREVQKFAEDMSGCFVFD